MSLSFFDAIRQGDRYEVERQLTIDPSLVHVQEEGLSPILVAAYHRQPGIASFLADKTIVLTIFEAAATGKINHVISPPGSNGPKITSSPTRAACRSSTR